MPNQLVNGTYIFHSLDNPHMVIVRQKIFLFSFERQMTCRKGLSKASPEIQPTLCRFYRLVTLISTLRHLCGGDLILALSFCWASPTLATWTSTIAAHHHHPSLDFLLSLSSFPDPHHLPSSSCGGSTVHVQWHHCRHINSVQAVLMRGAGLAGMHTE